MRTDFLNAHERHWKDAEHLYQIQRWANADHLYGMAAECGLKRLMQVFGMSFDAFRGMPTKREDLVHAHGIWDRYESYRSGHPDGVQTWMGYRILFEHWQRSGVAQTIRDRLQVVGAMVPDDEGRMAYLESLRERASDTFSDTLYDEIPPGESIAERFSFDETDESAPHYPLPIRWNRGFAALRSLHARLETIDDQEIRAVFGPLIDAVDAVFPGEKENHD